MSRSRAALLIVLSLACGAAEKPARPPARPAAPLSLPKVLCVAGSEPARPCRPADEVERGLSSPDLQILGAASTPSGIQGARVLTLRVPGAEPIVLRAKWRALSTLTSKNDPRRELVAYAIQKLYLEPSEYVVPPSAAHCFPLEVYRQRVFPRARQTVRAVPCVLGFLSYWLEDVTGLKQAGREGWFDWEDDALDGDLFEKNRIYRDSVANMNLLTYLIDHADTHTAQFVIRRDPSAPVVYSIDNSMSFGVKRNTRVRKDWAKIQVPALSRRHVERLRQADVDRLASIAELEPDAAGRMVPRPPQPRAADKHGIRWRDGRLVIGMTAAELDMLRDRVTLLFLAIDRGEVRVY